jgi:hypothetical protein
MAPLGVYRNRGHWAKKASGLSRPPRPHLEDEFGHGQGVAVAPVASRVDHDPLGPIELDHVGGAGGRAFGGGVEGHADPVPGFERGSDGVLLDVVDADVIGDDPPVAPEHVEDHPGPLVLVGQVGGMHQDQLAMLRRQVDVFEEDGRLVLRVLVQADLADPQDAGVIEELGDHLDDLARQPDVLGLLRVDAEPGMMRDLVEPRAVPLELDELAEVVAEPLGPRTVEPRPERRLAHQDAAGQGHPLVVVRGPRDHVDVRVDVIHNRAPRR